jgi:hypothetical protein
VLILLIEEAMQQVIAVTQEILYTWPCKSDLAGIKHMHRMNAVVPMRAALPTTHAMQHGRGLDCSLTTTLCSTWSNSMQVTWTVAMAATTTMSTGMAAMVTGMATCATVAPLKLLLELQAQKNCEEVLCAIC